MLSDIISERRHVPKGLKRLAKQCVKLCVGSENLRRLFFMHDRLRFPIDHPEDYRLAREPVDVLFYLDVPNRWQNIQLVVKELSERRPDLKLAVAYSGFWDIPPVDRKRVNFVNNVSIGNLYYFKTRVFYTPAINLPPLMKPPKARVVHTVVSMLSLDGVYTEHEFDRYDDILCIGPHHIDCFQDLASRRPVLRGKRLVPAGYPKLDLILSLRPSNGLRSGRSDRSVIIYAPTHTFEANPALASLRNHGEEILGALLDAGHRVIFRPHPYSFIIDKDRFAVEQICRLFAGNPAFSLDTSGDYSKSYSLADVMVTDLSGTGFTFSFGFGKPTVFFAPSEEAEIGLRGIQFEGRDRLGALVRDVNALIGKVAELCDVNMTAEIESFRAESIFNVGKSSAYIVTCIEDIVAGCDRPEWIRL
jgi:hypothetical protein